MPSTRSIGATRLSCAIARCPGTSREAAAAAAAHFALVRLYPDQAKDFDSFYQTSLAAVPDGEPKSKGIQLGEQVAAEILALRAKDGADAPNTYRPYTAAGIYVPTALPVASSWGQVTPFALKEAFAVPSCGSSFSAKRAMGEGL